LGMELADQQNSENSEGVVSGAEIGSAAPPADNAAPVEKTEKLTLRDQIVKSAEAVRTEEAKRARDIATGKFTKTEAAAEKPAPAEIPKPDEPAASSAEGPPSAWKGIWESLTPEARALAVKREAEVAKGFDEYRSKTAQYQEISQALDPIRPILQQSGIQSDAQAVKTLLQWEGSFRNPETRLQAFHNLAQQYGVDLSTLAQNSSQAPSQVQDIPEPLRPVIDQFGNIQQDVSAVKQELQTLRNERVSQELSNFAKDKPHFEAVKVLMGQLMQVGAAQDLDSAYQQATKIHPEVSAKIEAEKLAKEAAERERAQAEKATKARLAAVSPGSRSPNGAPASAAQAKQGVRGSILASITALRDEQRA
jgi:hypothetical protein